AAPGLLDGLAFLAELAGMKDPNAMAPAGALRHQLIHRTQRLDGRIAFFLDVGRAEFPGPGRGRGAAQARAQYRRRPDRSHRPARTRLTAGTRAVPAPKQCPSPFPGRVPPTRLFIEGPPAPARKEKG